MNPSHWGRAFGDLKIAFSVTTISKSRTVIWPRTSIYSPPNTSSDSSLSAFYPVIIFTTKNGFDQASQSLYLDGSYVDTSWVVVNSTNMVAWKCVCCLGQNHEQIISHYQWPGLFPYFPHAGVYISVVNPNCQSIHLVHSPTRTVRYPKSQISFALSIWSSKLFVMKCWHSTCYWKSWTPL